MIETINGISRLTERELESPRRTTRLIDRLEEVTVRGSIQKSLRGMKLLPWAPDLKSICWSGCDRIM